MADRGHDDVELLLEPNSHAAAKAHQEAIFRDGIPITAFAVDDIQKEFERLKNLAVTFSMESTETEGPTIALFDDTCGNFIQLYQD